MADTEKANHVATTANPKEAAKEAQNEYLSLVSKKVRSLTKKMAKVSEIEKKKAAGATINDEQKQLLEKKDITAKSLKEFESIKNQFVKIQSQEAKQKKKEEKRGKGELSDQVRPLVELIQVTSLISTSQDLKQNLTQEHLNTLATFAGYISQRQPNSTSDSAVDHAVKFLNQSEEAVRVGSVDTSYQRLRELLDVLRGSNTQQAQQPSSVVNHSASSDSTLHGADGVVHANESPSSSPEPFSELPPETTPATGIDQQVPAESSGASTLSEDASGAVDSDSSVPLTEQDANKREGSFQNKTRPFRGGRGRGRGGRGGRGGYYDANREHRQGGEYRDNRERGDNRRGGGAGNRGSHRGNNSNNRGRGSPRPNQGQYQQQQQQQPQQQQQQQQ